MKQGYLSEYFDGAAAKLLSAVEADVLTSNQHEFNGVKGLLQILGEPAGKEKYDATFMYLNDHEDEPIVEEGFLTWYDARQKAREERGVERWEYRLYFSDNIAIQRANEGDVLVIAKQPNGRLLAIIAESESTIAYQILWLFGFAARADFDFDIREDLDTEQDRIEFASRIILENIGIAVEATEPSFLENLLERFSGKFPSTRVFSDYARSTLDDVQIQDGLDVVIMAWIEREEILFRTMEKHIISQRLDEGFVEVDDFISYSLSVQNRRKSRAGLSLENHLEHLFQGCGIKYSRTAVTERKSKPDFLFPGQSEYHDPLYDPLNLTMLGVKTTCKERWRQVLPEAERIDRKHLFTLEAAISTHQTDEMESQNLQLVLPYGLHSSYTPEQQNWLFDISDFTKLVLDRQD